eukprot:scaffold139652_cov22-Tisochrysis_lutea.AAC.1
MEAAAARGLVSSMRGVAPCGLPLGPCWKGVAPAPLALLLMPLFAQAARTAGPAPVAQPARVGRESGAAAAPGERQGERRHGDLGRGRPDNNHARDVEFAPRGDRRVVSARRGAEDIGQDVSKLSRVVVCTGIRRGGTLPRALGRWRLIALAVILGLSINDSRLPHIHATFDAALQPVVG